MNGQPADPRTLRRDEALRLLASVPVGRVVFTLGALPAVEPVNFVVHGEAVVFGAGRRPDLAAAILGTVVAFQADAVDPYGPLAWSVTITGRAQRLQDPGGAVQRAAQAQAAPLEHPLIQIQAELVNGRLLPSGPAAGWPASSSRF